MKVSDTVRCVNSMDSESLNRGAIYTIDEINGHGNIAVRDSMGNRLVHFYKSSRFEICFDKNPKIVLGKQYIARNGTEVKIFAISDDVNYPVVGQIQDGKGNWRNEQWTSDGRYLRDQEDHHLDLVEGSPKSQAIFKYKGLTYSGMIDDTTFHKILNLLQP